MPPTKLSIITLYPLLAQSYALAHGASPFLVPLKVLRTSGTACGLLGSKGFTSLVR